ncbi:dihydroorotase [Limnohabitans sp. MORI2]|uniref:dihydroorotase n=1 Tax=Limnohabitans sp. MORI2 TaxID=1751150 RepID=UPI002376EB9A|nr:dihydroorotase [Limnohabitans sp. MORI2]BDU57596.1 dihydroorotase [Limnohabitans sp. MORI2]
MNILIQNGRVIDPASGFDHAADVAVADGHIVAIVKAGEKLPVNFKAEHTIDAKGCIVAPGLVDLQARLREPGYEHEGMLDSELTAAVAGGVTSLVCPPDTDPVLDEPGLIEMLKFRAEKLHRARVFPLGALTRGLKGVVLTEMSDLTDAGCVGFSQAEVPLENTQVLQRALQYAATFGYTVWLRPQEVHLGKGVAASGPLATRLGLSGVPVAAETIALHTIFALMRSTKARVHLCRISSAEGVELVRAAKQEGLAVTADVSINSLHLSDHDIGYFDSRARVTPVLRQQRDRDALRAALADGTIDVLVSDHMPVDNDGKALPFAEAESGATGLELLLSLSLKWANDSQVGLLRALDVLTAQPAKVLGKVAGQSESIGQLHVGGVADLVVFDPAAEWHVTPDALHSQGKHTPFAFDMTGMSLPARVKATLVAGRVAYQAA